jgi:hypothetical protein
LGVNNGQRKFNIYHKSVTDFLLGADSKTVSYYDVNGKSKEYDFSVSLVEAHQLFAQCLLQQIPNYTSQSLTEQSESLDAVSDYSVSHLLDHLDASGRAEEAKRFLFSLPWLLAVLVRNGVAELYRDVQRRAEGDEELTLIMKIIAGVAPLLRVSITVLL